MEGNEGNMEDRSRRRNDGIIIRGNNERTRRRNERYEHEGDIGAENQEEVEDGQYQGDTDDIEGD